nr:MAG TPA: hypothetical protein [Caudoviricetes sp.]
MYLAVKRGIEVNKKPLQVVKPCRGKISKLPSGKI